MHASNFGFCGGRPTVYDAGTSKELSAALGSASGESTIRLTADIDYNTGIAIKGKSIMFDLNGYTLNVVSSTGNGLEVNGGIVDMKGSGAFNVTSNADFDSVNKVYHGGVYADGGGQAKVTSATGTGRAGAGAFADTDGCITVTGDVKGSETGAYATNGGRVFVGGNAWGGCCAADARESRSLVEVVGNAAATDYEVTSGVQAFYGGTVRVTGNVTANNAGRGIHCYDGTVRIGGSVTAGDIGVECAASDHSDVTIDGTLTARLYIAMYGEKKVTDGVPGTGNNAGYLVYTRGGSIVRVKINSAAPSPETSSAGDCTLGGTGISACPISDMQVEMEKEVIDIVVRDGCSYVTCESWLHNTGDITDLLVGFPTQYLGGNKKSDTYSLTQFHWFRTLVDGKRVDVSLEKGLKPEGNNSDGLYFPQQYTWQMHFAADQRIKVVNTYWFVNPAEGADIDTADYILRGGAAWKGPVGSMTVRMHPEDFEMENTTFGGMQPTHIEEDGTVVWEAENIEPAKCIRADRKAPYGPGGVNPFAGNDGEFLPYRTMTLRMLRNFYAGYYNGATWWGNNMFLRFGDKQSSQLYYYMGVSYYKLGYTEKALDMFGRIHDNDELYGTMSAYYKALICKDAGDDAGYRTNLQSIEQYLSRIPEDKMSWGAYWLKSRLADITKQ